MAKGAAQRAAELHYFLALNRKRTPSFSFREKISRLFRSAASRSETVRGGMPTEEATSDSIAPWSCLSRKNASTTSLGCASAGAAAPLRGRFAAAGGCSAGSACAAAFRLLAGGAAGAAARAGVRAARAAAAAWL